MKKFNLEKFQEDLNNLIRKRTRITLSNELKITESMLFLLENGKQIPTRDTLNSICDLNGKDINDYFIELKEDDLFKEVSGDIKNEIKKVIECINIKIKYELLAKINNK